MLRDSKSTNYDRNYTVWICKYKIVDPFTKIAYRYTIRMLLAIPTIE